MMNRTKMPNRSSRARRAVPRFPGGQTRSGLESDRLRAPVQAEASRLLRGTARVEAIVAFELSDIPALACGVLRSRITELVLIVVSGRRWRPAHASRKSVFGVLFL